MPWKIVCPPVYQRMIPPSSVATPSVVTNGFIPNTVTATPLHSPTNAPMARHAMMHTESGTSWRDIRPADSTIEAAVVAPREKSMCPATSGKTAAIAIIRTAVWPPSTTFTFESDVKMSPLFGETEK